MSAVEEFTDDELIAYIAEELSLRRSKELENRLKDSGRERLRLSKLLLSLDDQPLSLAQIWRERRLSCPPRSTWQAYLAEEIHGEYKSYLQFHLDVMECRYCAANLADLQTSDESQAEGRVRKIFATSVGQLNQVQPVGSLKAPSAKNAATNG